MLFKASLYLVTVIVFRICKKTPYNFYIGLALYRSLYNGKRIETKTDENLPAGQFCFPAFFHES